QRSDCGPVRIGSRQLTMKPRNSSQLLILAAMLMFSGIACEAQEVKIVATLPEDSFIVSINGKEYRAINADKAREIQKLRVDFDAAQKVNAEQVIQIRELVLER